MKKRFPLPAALALILFASALTCLIIASTLGRELGFFTDRFGAVREYAALLAKIDEHYIGEYDVKDVSAAANSAAVDALGDRWSFYLTPEEYVRYMDSTSNRFTGIGIIASIDEASGGMLVQSVYKGSAAETGGLVAGDVITGIDGVGITGLEFDEMRSMLSRPIGDAAELRVLRGDGGELTLSVVYSVVFTDPVSYETLDGNIGYIKLENFETGSAKSFIAAMEELSDQGVAAFIFDVRGNGGGKVTEMTRILDYLLPEGEIFIAVDRSGREEVTLSDASMVDIPCAVLVNRYSFSAAEYFSATLMEYGYAVVVGEQTTGKDRSQITVTLPGGGALHISSAKFLTRNRVSLYDAGGLTPDHQIALTDDEFTLLVTGNLSKEDDPQLRFAAGFLTG